MISDQIGLDFCRPVYRDLTRTPTSLSNLLEYVLADALQPFLLNARAHEVQLLTLDHFCSTLLMLGRRSSGSCAIYPEGDTK